MLSQKKIKELIEKHKSAFKALEDFEKTGKVITKTRMNFTIDRELARKFREYCKNKGENMSSKMEEYIRKAVN